MQVTLTTGEDEVRGAQEYVGEGLQEAKIHQVCEEADSHHQYWKALKNIQTNQHTCRELDTSTQSVKPQSDLGVL